MNRCFELAEKGRGLTRSNPMVGALLVHNHQILAEGFHAQYGGAHAEVHCLNKVNDRDLISKSTLYISLEPCNFHGKTPPCTDLILNSGIKKVVIGSADFNPKVRFQGMDYLRSQELEIIHLNWEERQKKLNIRFFIHQTLHEPYFVGKLALSSNGVIGEIGSKCKITTPEIDVLGHKLRAGVDAILIGKTTWVNDQPSLNTRLYYSDFQPNIIVLHHDLDRVDETKDGRSVHFISAANIEELKTKIFALGYRNVLVEGGEEVLRFCMQEELLHEIHYFENQRLELNSGILAPIIPLNKYTLINQKNYFNHHLRHYLRHDLPRSEHSVFI